MHEEEHCQQLMEGDPAPLVSSSEAVPGELCPVLDSSVQGRYRTPERSPGEGNKDD